MCPICLNNSLCQECREELARYSPPPYVKEVVHYDSPRRDIPTLTEVVEDYNWIA